MKGQDIHIEAIEDIPNNTLITVVGGTIYFGKNLKNLIPKNKNDLKNHLYYYILQQLNLLMIDIFLSQKVQ